MVGFALKPIHESRKVSMIRNWPGRLSSLAPAQTALLVPLLLGIAIAWYFVPVNIGLGETGKAAVTLLNRGELADPYLIPTGPTAHVSPVIAGYLALIFAWLGVGTEAARFALGVSAACLYATSGFVTIKLLEQYGVSLWLRWTAALLIAFVPFSLFMVAVQLRQWDQPLAALILMMGWLVVARLRKGADPIRSGLALGGLAGLGGLVSPTLLPPFVLCIGWMSWLSWRGIIARQWWIGAASALVLILAFLLPWGIRNQQALGQFIVTRSNFGLELALGNRTLNPAVPYVANIRNVPLDFTVHPFESLPAAQDLARTGEIAFMQARRDEAVSWILHDIPRFIQHCLLRASLWLFPVQGDYFPILGPLLPFLYWNLLGFGLAVALSATLLMRARIMEGLIFVVLPMAPYFLTHMNPRYSYLVYFSSIAFCIIMADAAFSRGRALTIQRVK